MTDKPFQIFRLAALLEVPGALATFEYLQDEVWELIKFLRINNLASDDCLPNTKDEVTREFRLMSTDVTEEGLRVLRGGFHKWIDKNDNINRTSIDMAPLEKALEKVRGNK
ncbi:MAG: hypothetical protein UY39_C0002G0004 [Candidatus Kaiserbacteria bacterium GW2011_GWC2_49_12]|uniref:Uncharacterized protein n=3 Tax=Candidatus Kaiseribacteriota TaxID=1752734 RepID=A0A0G1YSV3_9BACT|nr:MAG: hypothetical protein UY39_C0002G0004 [Candidatus Kaiserbacteria bacterium GW2011_GWC2_49_12]KKW18092.1 MAG: hypothetical protein UY57_C0001G0002 [Candidatus Kaiserbacteria bacterium GW2011_GWB1_50_17]OGG87382.1 MAG: hypothetical protein A3H15_02470 [Candidatus Kaiserbacteria bacterium RIFCSPLOWO2_12_FULL_50_28]HCM43677.1 hypothetical protein [Candidatus Kaiserbacteria bacterium]